MITSFSRSEALEEAIMVSVTAKVTYSTTPPELDRRQLIHEDLR